MALTTNNAKNLNFKLTREYALGLADEYQVKIDNRRGTVIHRHSNNTLLPSPNDSVKYENPQKKELSKLSSYVISYVIENVKKNKLTPHGSEMVDGYIDSIEDANGKEIISVQNIQDSQLSESNILLRFAIWLIE
jgi:hypothetical protein